MGTADFTAHVAVEAFALFHCVYLMLARQENVGWACCQSISIEPDLFHAHLLLLGRIPAEVVNCQSSLALKVCCTCLQQAMPGAG